MTEALEKDYNGVLLRRHPAEGNGVVAEIVLNRAEAMNAISTGMAAAIRDVAPELADDPAVRAVVVSSAAPSAEGKNHAFCVGVDLKERNQMSDAELVATRPAFRRTWSAFGSLPMPVIAAVSGYALGGGCELALGCDLIVADDGAVFGLPEVSVGVIPGGGGTQTLVRRVGMNRAADLIFTARRIDADEADRFGMIDRRVAGASTARAAALELAQQIAKNSPIGVRNAKHALKVGADLPLAAGLDVEDGAWRATAFSADRAEGVRAFVEKRKPVWP
ncbi:enoyl-CoA hydratase/isomerase family protein [Catenulispora subtropica]|uniref:Enoyl-CoA hydratase-related protein n=1 Tax=Catenulispora subtropica TaxID=450798 RepID=A0ABN2QUC0_9ACTN